MNGMLTLLCVDEAAWIIEPRAVSAGLVFLLRPSRTLDLYEHLSNESGYTACVHPSQRASQGASTCAGTWQFLVSPYAACKWSSPPWELPSGAF